MADKEKKVEEAEVPATEQVELVGEASEKAEAEAIEALPKVEEAECRRPRRWPPSRQDAGGLRAAAQARL